MALTAPANVSLAKGDTAQLRGLAEYGDGSRQFVTTAATWATSNPTVATVDGSGIVTAAGLGEARIAISLGGKSTGVVVDVVAASTATTFSGTLAAANNVPGTTTFTIFASMQVSADVVLPRKAGNLQGTFGSPANVIDISGGGYRLIGTLNNGVLSGTFIDPESNSGAFSAIDSTHSAVTLLCGTYQSDRTTPFGNADSGVWNVQVSLNGGASAESMTSDGSGPPLLFTGRTDGSTLTMTSTSGGSASGAIQNDAVTGAFTIAGGGTATFSASAAACP